MRYMVIMNHQQRRFTMSAFIITAEQMAINCNVIAGAIGYSPVFNHWVVQVKDSLVIEKELSESDKIFFKEINEYWKQGTDKKIAFNLVARMLVQANYEGVIDRYNKCEDTSRESQDFYLNEVLKARESTVEKAKTQSYFQLVKSLRCLDYQCSDWKEYKKSLAKNLLSSTEYFALDSFEEFMNAKWC